MTGSKLGNLREIPQSPELRSHFFYTESKMKADRASKKESEIRESIITQ